MHVALVSVQLMFASLSPVGKIALDHHVPPLAVVMIRIFAGALVFLGVWLLSGRERIAVRDAGRFVVLGLLGLTFNQILFIEGLARTSATSAVVLGASIPVLTVGVAVALRRERATLQRALGLLVALGGSLAITLGGWRGGELVGNALVVANSLCYASYLVLSRDMLARYRTMTVVAHVFLFGTLTMLPIGGLVTLRALPNFDASAVAAVTFLVLFPTVGTYLLTAFALARLESSRVAAYIYIQPLFGALMAAALLGERPGLGTLWGGAAIFAGIALTNFDARRSV